MGKEVCNLSFPAWMPEPLRNLFCEMVIQTPIQQKPLNYDACHGAILQDSENSQHKWFLDLVQYTYHPASIWKKGDNLGPSKNFSDNRNVIAVKSIEIYGNGDTEKGGNERLYGNIWGTITAGQCASVSPFIETDGDDYIGRMLEKFQEGQNKLSYKKLGFPDDIEDMRDVDGSAIAIFPGPYHSDTFPAGKDAKPQCEFGLKWQKITYKQGKPLLDTDDERLPDALRGAQNYCVRFWESDGPAFWTDDTPLLQFTVNLNNLKQTESLTFAHNPVDQNSIISGSDAVISPALFKIELEFLKEVEEPVTWGK